MKAKFILTSVLFAISINAFAAHRIQCAPVSSSVPEGRTVADYQSFFDANKIIPKTSLSVNFVEQFKNEFEKFPVTLHRELIRAGNKVHIMEGDGVTVDPTWDPHDEFTFDGRPWKDVPGGGGSTARGYVKSPTRVVINHLYDKQGSVNMLIHEHAHSLDSIKDLHGISRSTVWQELVTTDTLTFLDKVCGKYCTDNVEEGFAELFAHYHGCSESRDQLEKDLPRVAEFFRRFTSTRKLDTIWSDEASEESDERGPEASRTRICRRIVNRRVCI